MATNYNIILDRGLAWHRHPSIVIRSRSVTYRVNPNGRNVIMNLKHVPSAFTITRRHYHRMMEGRLTTTALYQLPTMCAQSNLVKLRTTARDRNWIATLDSDRHEEEIIVSILLWFDHTRTKFPRDGSSGMRRKRWRNDGKIQCYLP